MNNNTREIYNAMNDIAIVLSPLSEKLKLLGIIKDDLKDPSKMIC